VPTGGTVAVRAFAVPAATVAAAERSDFAVSPTTC
jgi:hypothetical protein